MTNNGFLRWITIEGLLSFLAMIILGAMAWQSLASDVIVVTKDVEAVKKQVTTTEKTLVEIKVNQATHKEQLKNQGKDIIDLKDGQRRILDILERRFQ